MLGNQHAGGNAQVGRGPERQGLFNVITPVGAADHLRLGSDCRRSVEQVLKHLGPRAGLPPLQILEPGMQQ